MHVESFVQKEEGGLKPDLVPGTPMPRKRPLYERVLHGTV